MTSLRCTCLRHTEALASIFSKSFVHTRTFALSCPLYSLARRFCVVASASGAHDLCDAREEVALRAPLCTILWTCQRPIIRWSLAKVSYSRFHHRYNYVSHTHPRIDYGQTNICHGQSPLCTSIYICNFTAESSCINGVSGEADILSISFFDVFFRSLFKFTLSLEEE